MPKYLVITERPDAYIAEFDNIEDALSEYIERRSWGSDVYIAEKLEVKTIVLKNDTVLAER